MISEIHGESVIESLSSGLLVLNLEQFLQMQVLLSWFSFVSSLKNHPLYCQKRLFVRCYFPVCFVGFYHLKLLNYMEGLCCEA